MPLLSPSLPCFAAPLLATLLLAPSVQAQADDPDRRIHENEDGSLRLAVREELLGFQDPGMASPDFLLSPDGMHMAYILAAGGEFSVVRDGVEGESFKGIVIDSLEFSADSQHLLYIATRDNKKYIVVDERMHELFAIIAPGPSFSPDGSRFAWIGEDETVEQFVVIDGERKTSYDGITEEGVRWSPDGTHHAYVANLDGLQSVVRDDVEGPFLEDIVLVSWSHVGNHLSYVGKQGDTYFVFHDGELVAEAEGFGKDGFVYPKAGERYAIALRRGETWSLLVDGQEEGAYKNLLGGISFCEDGSHYAYVAGRGTGKFFVLDGEEQAGPTSFESFRFSPDGEHVFLVVADEEGSRRVARDGEAQAPFLEILPPGVVFSDSGKHYFYVGRQQEQKVVVFDGKPGPPTRSFAAEPVFMGEHLVYTIRNKGEHVLYIDGVAEVPRDKIRDLSFSQDGRSYAYWAGKKLEWTLVIGGKEQASYPFAPSAPVFSPDGESIAYVAGRDRRVFVVVDGKKGKAHDFVGPNTLVFTPDGEHVAYCAGTADRRYLVVDDVVVENKYTAFRNTDAILAQDSGHLAVPAARLGVWLMLWVEIL